LTTNPAFCQQNTTKNSNTPHQIPPEQASTKRQHKDSKHQAKASKMPATRQQTSCHKANKKQAKSKVSGLACCERIAPTK